MVDLFFFQNEFIQYYGYIPEEHKVTTEDGYILTVFRCNSRKPFENTKKVVVLLHGILCSSDDFVMNPPHQSLGKSKVQSLNEHSILNVVQTNNRSKFTNPPHSNHPRNSAYVMADENYDVWIVNNRGNFYSRNHSNKSPNDRNSGFWDFSWDDIGLLDYPATFEYIRQMTGQSKLYVVAHSQGTSALMALLSEKPEFNAQIHAVSLMAPVSYLTHAEFFYRMLSILERPLQVNEHFGIQI